MKVAIPTNDRVKICPHFGRTQGFMIYLIEENEIKYSEYRRNVFTDHALGKHDEHSQNHDEQHNHSHNRIINALQDCELVIAGGMGQRLIADLKVAGKEIILTGKVHLFEIIQEYLQGILEHDESISCQH